MLEGSWDVVIIGVAVDLRTNQVRSVELAIRGGEDAAFVLSTGDRTMPAQTRTAAQQDAVISFLFGAGDSGGERTDGQTDRVLRDPVNLDGSPRNRLRDRLAVKSLVERQAAD